MAQLRRRHARAGRDRSRDGDRSHGVHHPLFVRWDGAWRRSIRTRIRWRSVRLQLRLSSNRRVDEDDPSLCRSRSHDHAVSTDRLLQPGRSGRSAVCALSVPMHGLHVLHATDHVDAVASAVAADESMREVTAVALRSHDAVGIGQARDPRPQGWRATPRHRREVRFTSGMCCPKSPGEPATFAILRQTHSR
jgi:hypothetical protein